MIEKLSDMLSKEQLELVKKELRIPSAYDVVLKLIHSSGNTRIYKDLGRGDRWQFDFNNAHVVGVRRRRGYYQSA